VRARACFLAATSSSRPGRRARLQAQTGGRQRRKTVACLWRRRPLRPPTPGSPVGQPSVEAGHAHGCWGRLGAREGASARRRRSGAGCSEPPAVLTALSTAPHSLDDAGRCKRGAGTESGWCREPRGWRAVGSPCQARVRGGRLRERNFGRPGSSCRCPCRADLCTALCTGPVLHSPLHPYPACVSAARPRRARPDARHSHVRVRELRCELGRLHPRRPPRQAPPPQSELNA
jgi:hypothetical protein